MDEFLKLFVGLRGIWNIFQAYRNTAPFQLPKAIRGFCSIIFSTQMSLNEMKFYDLSVTTLTTGLLLALHYIWIEHRFIYI